MLVSGCLVLVDEGLGSYGAVSHVAVASLSYWHWFPGASYSTPILEAERRNPSYSPDTADFDSPTFTFDSLDEDEDMGEGGGEEAGEGGEEQGDTYDAEAAREQMRRIEERRRMKRGGEGEEAWARSCRRCDRKQDVGGWRRSAEKERIGGSDVELESFGRSWGR
jgi:hypothetical protein